IQEVTLRELRKMTPDRIGISEFCSFRGELISTRSISFSFVQFLTPCLPAVISSF
ncbi:Hypothetical protein FKW44_015847, partial [Caligus rogercresseyi]